jgi:hypothetical protein
MSQPRSRLPAELLAGLPEGLEQWLSPKQVSAILGVSEKWLAAAREGRKGIKGPPYKKVGAGKTAPVRYPAHSLRAWMHSFETVINNAGGKPTMCRSFSDFNTHEDQPEPWLFALDLEKLSCTDFLAAITTQEWHSKLLLRWLKRDEYRSGAIFPLTRYVTASEYQEARHYAASN